MYLALARSRGRRGDRPRLVANIDVAPTIADAVGGLGVVIPMDGRSMLEPGQSRSRLLLEWYGVNGRAGLGVAPHADLALHRVLRQHRQPVDQVPRVLRPARPTPGSWTTCSGTQVRRTTRTPHRCRRSSRPIAHARARAARSENRALCGVVWLSSPAMTRIHKTSMAVLLAVAALALGACGGDDEGNGGPVPPGPAPPTPRVRPTPPERPGPTRPRRASGQARPTPARARATTRAAAAATAAAAAAAEGAGRTTPAGADPVAPAEAATPSLRRSSSPARTSKSTAKTVCTASCRRSSRRT